MSTTGHRQALLDQSRAEGRSGRNAVDLLYWVVGALGALCLCFLALAHNESLASRVPTLVPWIAIMAVANLLPVSGWYSTSLAPDLPVAVAAAMTLNPLETGIVAFLGAFDPKEFRREIPVRKAIFNRTQVAVADVLGSIVGHGILSDPSSSPMTLPIALAVLATIVAINIALVGPFISLERRVSLFDVVRRLHPGAPLDLILAFLAWAVLGAMLVTLYAQIHVWALLAFLAPALLGGQFLARSQMFLDAVHAYQSRERALVEISRRIQDERTDERRLIAADLHDEVLQPLFKVSLMAHVIKADLASGRLLDIDQDLPELLSAAEIASTTLRELIGNLRESTLGRGGLYLALGSLVRALQSQTSARMRTRIHSIRSSPEVELVAYQIAKEALTNALAHSRAGQIFLSLESSHRQMILSISDNGVGFDPVAKKEGHYGLHIMKERAASVGGTLHIDSVPGKGCTIRFYADAALT